MKKNNGSTKEIIIIAAEIAFTALSVIFNLLYPNPSPVPFLSVPILSRLVLCFPYLGLGLCFMSWTNLRESISISRKSLFSGELYIFFWGFLISLIFIRYLWDPGFGVAQCLFFVLVVTSSNFIRIQKKILLLGLIVSGIVSLLASYSAYPFYKSSHGQILYFLLPMSDLRVSFFYVMVFETAMLSLLFAFAWMSYMNSFMTEFLGRPAISISATKSIATHFQIIPIVLSPIAVIQIFGKTEFLEPATLLLFMLCYGKLITAVICPVIAAIGKRVFSIKFLGLTSLWALISFVQNFFVVFNFIALHLEAGSYAFVLIISSLFASVLGIASSRIQ